MDRSQIIRIIHDYMSISLFNIICHIMMRISAAVLYTIPRITAANIHFSYEITKIKLQFSYEGEQKSSKPQRACCSR